MFMQMFCQFDGASLVDQLDTYMTAVGATLDARAQGVLPRISDRPRRLLAIRGYLQERNLGGKWAWTSAEETAFRATEDFTNAQTEIERVKSEFASRNEGFSLSTANLVRSLDTQIRLWNGNESVATAAGGLLTRSSTEIHSPQYNNLSLQAAAQRFARFLRSVDVSPSPMVATPGLSGHGRLNAVDFLIRRGTERIAGPDTATRTWDSLGWTEKLRQAVNAASSHFEGPLPRPYEPWHYTFQR